MAGKSSKVKTEARLESQLRATKIHSQDTDKKYKAIQDDLLKTQSAWIPH